MANLLDTKSSCHSPTPGEHPHLHNKTEQARTYLVMQEREGGKRIRRGSLLFRQEPLRSIGFMP